MKYRPVREFLDQAMEEVEEFNTTVELRNLIAKRDYISGPLEIRYQGFDYRIGWESYLVSINGIACGHVNGVPVDWAIDWNVEQ